MNKDEKIKCLRPASIACRETVGAALCTVMVDELTTVQVYGSRSHISPVIKHMM